MKHLEQLSESPDDNPIWLNKLLFNLEEKQRSQLAKDLHDSGLQDLISFRRQIVILNMGIENSSPEEIKKHFNNILENLVEIERTTRETCNELRPQVLYDLGLKNALQKLVNQYDKKVPFDIILNTKNFNISTSIDEQLNMYRIIQELLNNAQKHSQASSVVVMLVNIKEKIIIHYEDDGVGAEYSNVFGNKDSMGLSGVKERARLLDGTMDVTTAPGKGFKVIIEI